MNQPRKLSGTQRLKLQDALLSAFPRYDNLRQMVQFQLGQNLDSITGGARSPLETVVFDLIQWAEAHGRTYELIKGAHIHVPGNPDLKVVFHNGREWFGGDIYDSSDADSGSDIRSESNLPTDGKKLVDYLFIL